MSKHVAAYTRRGRPLGNPERPSLSCDLVLLGSLRGLERRLFASCNVRTLVHLVGHARSTHVRPTPYAREQTVARRAHRTYALQDHRANFGFRGLNVER